MLTFQSFLVFDKGDYTKYSSVFISCHILCSWIRDYPLNNFPDIEDFVSLYSSLFPVHIYEFEPVPMVPIPGS